MAFHRAALFVSGFCGALYRVAEAALVLLRAALGGACRLLVVGSLLAPDGLELVRVLAVLHANQVSHTHDFAVRVPAAGDGDFSGSYGPAPYA